MARKNVFGRDRGLQARMTLTLFLLGLVYAILVGVLVAAGAGAVTIAVIAGALFLLQFFTSDKIALLSMGAREVTPADAPRLHAIIDRLCVRPCTWCPGFCSRRSRATASSPPTVARRSSPVARAR